MIPKAARRIIKSKKSPTKTYRIKGNRIIGFVDGKKAMEQMIYKTLRTERYQYLIYSWRYGAELAGLFGKQKEWVIPEAERRIKEALIVDDRVLDVNEFEFETEQKGSLLIRFTVSTIFGELEQEVRVNV